MPTASSVSIDRRADRGLGRPLARDIRKTGIAPDHWYPLARARDLRRASTLGVSFAGEPIVLARTATGRVFALEDRCAHRQVPLSLGEVKGERLLCTYHCWAYNHTGACINVPYLDQGKGLPNGVKSYPCVEAYGLIFVYPGNVHAPGILTFPQITTQGNPAYRTRYLDRRIACHYSFMHENLMDMNHQYLHRSLMGSINPKALDIREGDGWVEVDYTFHRAAGKQPIGEKFMLGRRTKTPDAKAEAREDKDIMTIRTGYPYQTLQFWTAGASEPALDLWNAYVPTDAAQRHNHTFGLMSVRKPGVPGTIHLLWPFIVAFTNGIFGQDEAIVEAEQRAFDAQGRDENNEIFPIIQKLRHLLVEQGVPL
ncbi:aromatic ring-hydroxylating dioxygenase subunit alpha [Salinisphaera sp. Q1T1-3]|uniref:aromatic ring-hydroxylating oxygenase subunit alpha n=1 Tax=Salinisphaera sp. Q1T1-3 TaxID=2321229 RepID=UPI000E723186|nr:aromatic ring-hydroxylating dioxygenase subunit alpha [Salinisphaera sp. Q1T1-3]RJS91607.1 aromatic ring-hydroxylating dioxygenase subunit alpha [Salinisphaera sp. Q1T1-3]